VEAIFMYQEPMDVDHFISGLLDDAIKAGLATTDEKCFDMRVGKIRAEDPERPAGVWLVAQEEEIEEAWPTSLWR
jgi:hypothetical protein